MLPNDLVSHAEQIKKLRRDLIKLKVQRSRRKRIVALVRGIRQWVDELSPNDDVPITVAQYSQCCWHGVYEREPYFQTDTKIKNDFWLEVMPFIIYTSPYKDTETAIIFPGLALMTSEEVEYLMIVMHDGKRQISVAFRIQRDAAGRASTMNVSVEDLLDGGQGRVTRPFDAIMRYLHSPSSQTFFDLVEASLRLRGDVKELSSEQLKQAEEMLAMKWWQTYKALHPNGEESRTEE